MVGSDAAFVAAAGAIFLAIAAALWALMARRNAEDRVRVLQRRLQTLEQRAEAAQAGAEAFDSAVIILEDGEARLASGEDSFQACADALGPSARSGRGAARACRGERGTTPAACRAGRARRAAGVRRARPTGRCGSRTTAAFSPGFAVGGVGRRPALVHPLQRRAGRTGDAGGSPAPRARCAGPTRWLQAVARVGAGRGGAPAEPRRGRRRGDGGSRRLRTRRETGADQRRRPAPRLPHRGEPLTAAAPRLGDRRDRAEEGRTS